MQCTERKAAALLGGYGHLTGGELVKPDIEAAARHVRCPIGRAIALDATELWAYSLDDAGRAILWSADALRVVTSIGITTAA